MSDPMEAAEKMSTIRAMQALDTLVRAGRLDVTGLLALVAHALTLGLGRAVTRNVANLTTYSRVNSRY
jgi:hypothetical protein